MKISKTDPQTDIEMDMTPMIDIVFQLIIFFMLITDMSQKDLELLVLPPAETASPDDPNPLEVRPIVNIVADGKIFVKGDLLYDVFDANPDFFRAPIEKSSRSYMNVVWRLPSEELEARFVAEAKEAGMVGLKGHRSVGGCRASMYNAMEPEGVETLAQFMEEFARKNG